MPLDITNAILPKESCNGIVDTKHGRAVEYRCNDDRVFVFIGDSPSEYEIASRAEDARAVFDFKSKYDLGALKQRLINHFKQPVKILIDDGCVIARIGTQSLKILLEDIGKPVKEILNS